MTAFGKDPSILRNVGSFRQLSGQFSGGRSSRAPRGGVPYFLGQYKPPERDSDCIALVAGQYEQIIVDESGDAPVAVSITIPHVLYREHFDGITRTSAICSAGPFFSYKDLRTDCNGCDIYWATLEPDEDGKKRSARMSRQQKYAVGITDFSVYHNQPAVDQTGRPRVNKKTNKQYFNWVKCEGMGCNGCKAKLESKFGHNPHWPMSYSYFETLRMKDRQIGKSCRDCNGVDTIRAVAWTCKGCGEAAIDMKSTTLKAEDVIKVSEAHFSCPSCGRKDFLEEIVTCTNCSLGERMTIFDVEFKIMQTTQGKQSTLDISNWTRRRPLTGDLAVLDKPKELLRIFAPTNNQVQINKFGLPPLSEDAGQATTPPQEQSRAYGDQYRP